MATESIEVLIEGGKATAAPPLGPALGPLGVNIGQVVAEINKKTADFKKMQVPVTVSVDSETKEFSISVGTPPASALLKKEAGIDKASGKAKEEFVADLRIENVIKVAKMKEDGLMGATFKANVKEILGTCLSMGIKVENVTAKEALKMVDEGKFDKEIEAKKTEVTDEELKAMEKERTRMQEELKEKRAQFEATAKKVLEELKGKSPKEVKAKMKEAGLPDQIINEFAPKEEKPKK